MIRVHGRAEGAPETLPPGQSGILRGAGIDRSRMYGCRDYVRTWSAADPASIGQSLPQDNLCHGRGRRKTDARAASRRKASACKQILNRKASACIQRISLVKYGTRRTTYRICINTGPVHANNSKPRRPPTHAAAVSWLSKRCVLQSVNVA